MPTYPPRTTVRRALLMLAAGSVLAASAASVAGCGANEPAVPTTPSDKRVTVYSGRSESLVKPLLEKFTQTSGITVETRYGNTAQMAAQLLEEGDRSPADVFFAQDAGALGAVNKKGLFATLPEEILAKVPAPYRATGGEWVGVTARSRVLAYNPDLVPVADLPVSVFELTGPQWRGKVGVVPTNASFQAFVTAIRVQHGDEKARQFLAGLKANEPQIRDGNAAVLEDVNAGKIAVGLINHYYVGEVAKELGTTPDGLKAKLHFFPNGDTGALVNVAGVGVLKKAANDPDARALLDYLLGTEAQTYFAENTYEYPLVAEAPAPAGVPQFSELKAPAVNLNDLDTLEATVAMIKESGLTP